MKFKKVLIWFILFNFIIGPRLDRVDLLLLATTLIFFVAIIYIVFMKKSVDRMLLRYLMICLLPLSYNILISGLWGFRDTTGLELAFKLMSYSIGAYFIVYLYRKVYKNDFLEKILNHIFWIGVTDSVFIITVYASNTVRYYLLNNVLAYSYDEHTRVFSGLRSFSMSMGVGAHASVALAFFFIIGISLIIENGKSHGKIIIGLITIFIAALLTARTGLNIIIFGIPAYYIFSKIILKRKKIKLYKVFKIAPKVIILAFIVFVGLNLFANDNAVQRFRQTTLSWAFEQFDSKPSSSAIGTRSMDIVFGRMYFLPDSDIQTLFGNSNYGRRRGGFEYISSDVGYIRMIHGSGIIGTVLAFLPIIYLGCFALKNKKSVLASDILLFIVLAVFVVNFKELFYMARGSTSIMMIVFNIIIVEKSLAYERGGIG